jgi:DNA-binding GntR family transcriptional regulator
MSTSTSLSDFVRDDLRRRLQRGAEAPPTLTLPALAAHYGVSFTPVRRAVAELIRGRVLRRQGNGRLESAAARTDGAAPAEPAAALPPDEARALESSLTDEIIRMSLAGREEFLREEATAGRCGVGRTVLRAVLSRLAGKGLIEHLPRRGFRVRPFNRDDMIAFLQVRESLELKALDLAMPHVVRQDLERMLEGNRPAPDRRAAQLDNDLHDYLIEKSGNRYIRDFFERHGIYYTTLFAYAAPGARVVRAMARQHRAILNALIAADRKAARRALARHIRSQRPVVARLMRNLTRGAPANGGAS